MEWTRRHFHELHCIQYCNNVCISVHTPTSTSTRVMLCITNFLFLGSTDRSQGCFTLRHQFPQSNLLLRYSLHLLGHLPSEEVNYVETLPVFNKKSLNTMWLRSANYPPLICCNKRWSWMPKPYFEIFNYNVNNLSSGFLDEIWPIYILTGYKLYVYQT